jgi:hypothetical protein
MSNEYVHAILGVEGRMFARGLFSTQTWGATRSKGNKQMSVEMRFDDNCKNGHMSFAITGELRQIGVKGYRGMITAGACHEEIGKWFPELAPLIKWHLTSTDGPMHYLANTVYLAGDRDHNGLRKGETRQIRNGRTGLPCWRLIAMDANGEPFELYQVPKAYEGDKPPPVTHRLEWHPWNRIGEGKERQLDAARGAAVWPEATNEDLCKEPGQLRAVLEARLPGLLAAFRRDMTEVCGFEWR